MPQVPQGAHCRVVYDWVVAGCELLLGPVLQGALFKTVFMYSSVISPCIGCCICGSLQRIPAMLSRAMRAACCVASASAFMSQSKHCYCLYRARRTKVSLQLCVQPCVSGSAPLRESFLMSSLFCKHRLLLLGPQSKETSHCTSPARHDIAGQAGSP